MPLQRLARYRFLRRIALYMLRALGPGDIVVQHYWWPDVSLSLHAYKHRGYWFKGKRRERHVMERLAQLVKAGDTVIEIGAHFSRIAQMLSAMP